MEDEKEHSMKKIRMQVLLRVLLGLGLLGSVLVTPMAASAQGFGGVAQFCAEIIGAPFATVGDCVSFITTAFGPGGGNTDAVAECKLIFAELSIPPRFFGDCVTSLGGPPA